MRIGVAVGAAHVMHLAVGRGEDDVVAPARPRIGLGAQCLRARRPPPHHDHRGVGPGGIDEPRHGGDAPAQRQGRLLGHAGSLLPARA